MPNPTAEPQAEPTPTPNDGTPTNDPAAALHWAAVALFDESTDVRRDTRRALGAIARLSTAANDLDAGIVRIEMAWGSIRKIV